MRVRNMDKKFAIFDMDGTLVDSMSYWQGLAREYLREKDVQEVSEALLNQTKTMTVHETGAVFQREYGLKETPEEISRDMNAIMERHYREDIALKEGVGDYLETLRRAGVRMCVASATAEPLIEICLKRLGILSYFDFLLSCETVGVGKSRPDIYLQSAERLGGTPAETAVYEDAAHAAETAKDAGFYVVGIYDEESKDAWEELKAVADEVLLSYL